MWSRRLWATLAYLACAFGIGEAQEKTVNRVDKIHEAIDAVFPGGHFRAEQTTWASGGIDFNGDGMNDLAVIAIGGINNSEVRLLVLAGGVGGGYTPLSVSGEICHVNKWYNLSASTVGKSFEVEFFYSGDATQSSSSTLKFRYNARLNDFELVGREDQSTNHDENTSYRVSVNYLTKTVMHSRRLGKSYIERRTAVDGIEEIVEHSRQAGRYREVKAQFDSSALFRLQGFDCESYYKEDPAGVLPLYIEEDFTVRRR